MPRSTAPGTRLDTGENKKENVEQLEKDLQTAQASNLISGAERFYFRNGGRVATDGKLPRAIRSNNWARKIIPPASSGRNCNRRRKYVSAKVQPLRVNLPVRGQHFAFTQVLQTEGGQPMTIRLFATSTKAVSWPLRGLIATGAFLILWLTVIVLSRLTLRAGRE